MKNSFLTFFLLGVLATTFSQSPFQRTIGTSADEQAKKILKTPDKGYILLGGVTDVAYNLSSCLVKTDSIGNKIWSKSYGLILLNVIQTDDGGYLLCGGGTWFQPDMDLEGYLVKTDSLGNVIWTYSYGATSMFTSVKKTLDGTGYIVAGQGGSIPYNGRPTLIKFDLSGNKQWTNVIGNGGTALDIVQLKTDSCFYVVNSYVLNTFDPQIQNYPHHLLLSKVSKSGTGYWTKDIITSNALNFPYGVSSKILATYNNHLLLNLTQQKTDIIEVDTSGQMIQAVGYPFPMADWDLCHPTSDNSIYLTKSTGSNQFGWDIMIAKSSQAGTVNWAKRIGGVKNDFAFGIITSKDKGFTMAGSSENFNVGGSDLYLIKGDSTGVAGCHDSAFVFTTTIPSVSITAVSFSFGTVFYLWNIPRTFGVANAADTVYDACGCIPPKAIFGPGNSLDELVDRSTWATNTYWDFGGGYGNYFDYYPNGPVGTTTTIPVCLKVTNACGADSVCHLMTFESYTLSIKAVEADPRIECYPNPTNGEITVAASNELGMLILYNATGEKVFQLASKNNEEKLEIKSLLPGIYILQVQKRNLRIVKE